MTLCICHQLKVAPVRSRSFRRSDIDKNNGYRIAKYAAIAGFLRLHTSSKWFQNFVFPKTNNCEFRYHRNNHMLCKHWTVWTNNLQNIRYSFFVFAQLKDILSTDLEFMERMQFIPTLLSGVTNFFKFHVLYRARKQIVQMLTTLQAEFEKSNINWTTSNMDLIFSTWFLDKPHRITNFIRVDRFSSTIIRWILRSFFLTVIIFMTFPFTLYVLTSKAMMLPFPFRYEKWYCMCYGC